MSWRVKRSMSERLASIAAMVFVAAFSANSAAAGSGPDQSAGDPAATPSPESPAKSAPAARGRVRAAGSLQHRVDVLAKALQLDARQRTQLLTILESQRQAVSNIWSDPKLLPAERTPATRALQERTANQIRAILTDEQRKLYNPPKPQGAEPPSPNVEEWMRKQSQAQARQQQ
jgi:hypothetical protein